MTAAWGNKRTLVWPNGTDIDPGVLYDWPQHVDAIVQRRRQRFALEAPVLERVQPLRKHGAGFEYLNRADLIRIF